MLLEELKVLSIEKELAGIQESIVIDLAAAQLNDLGAFEMKGAPDPARPNKPVYDQNYTTKCIDEFHYE